MVKISRRMKRLASLVSEGAVLADVGTDHGYLPIYLLQAGRIRRAFALDIKEGPLLRAKEHIRAFGLEDYITVRRSDGVAALLAGEADSVLIAGMGGGTMLHILEEGKEVILAAKELILQPQSEISRVREYICRNGYRIDREDMVYEDGKYYPMLHVICKGCGDGFSCGDFSKQEWQMFLRYGKCLFDGGGGVLGQYLKDQIKQYEAILESLSAQQKTEAVLKRREEILAELTVARRAMAYHKEG